MSFHNFQNDLQKDWNQPFSRFNQPLLYFFLFQGSHVVLSSVGRVDAGDYICKADNGVGHGAVREAVKLEVLCE